ncbi:MAG: trigger factor [Buchnera aphidicola (Nurudea shiraii)]
MKLKIEENQNLFKKIHITIPNDVIQKYIQLEFITLNNTIKVNGFRKGKTPLLILVNKYGEKVQQQVLQKLIKKYFLNIVSKKKLHVAGMPKFIFHKYKTNSDFNFSIELEIYPQFILNIHQKTINIPKINITNKDIQTIAYSMFKKDVWIEVNQKITLHDKVTIACIFNNSTKHQKYNVQNFQFIIGTNKIFSQIEKKLFEHKVNESFLINITFSEYHCEEKIAGKTFEIKVIIKKVEKLEQNLIQQKAKNTAYLNAKNFEKIKNILKNQSDIIVKQHIKSQIIQCLIKSNPIDVPSTLIQENFLILKQKNKELYEKNNKNVFIKDFQKNLILKAKNKVITAILIQKFIKDNSLEPNLNTIDLLIKNIATSQDHIKTLMYLYKNNKNVKKYLNNIDLEGQVITQLEKKFIKNFKECNFCKALYNLNNIKSSNI